MKKLTLEAVLEYDARYEARRKGAVDNIENILNDIEVYTAGRMKHQQVSLTVEDLQDYVDKIREELQFVEKYTGHKQSNIVHNMTYEEMMTIGRECGLITVGDCYDNIANHPGLYFSLSDINEELLFLQKDICRKNPTEFKKAFSVSDDLVQKWNGENDNDMER